MVLSQTANVIKLSNIGYRNDYLFSGEDYLIEEVLDFEINELYNHDIFEFTGLSKISEILIYAHNKLNTKARLYGYWMTSRDGVIHNYANGDNQTVITQFTLPKDYIILSDLDDEGVLIISETPKSLLLQKSEQTNY